MAAVPPEGWNRLPRIPAAGGVSRPVQAVVTAPRLLEGAGFPVRRPFPGPGIGFREADPFLLLDHMGPVDYGPGEAKGAPWHPHRGFETVTYMLEGVLRHQDSHGGGGVIAGGDTQWMTAGAGILHDEMPDGELVARGGRFHGVQLWVNLPRVLKWTPPRYQSLAAAEVKYLTTARGDGLVRVIAGAVAGVRGPGRTWTPVTVVHVSLEPEAELSLPWPPAYNALAYVLEGSGTAGPERVLVHDGQGIRFGAGDRLCFAAAARPGGSTGRLEVLILGGQPLREPVAAYGPFVMNTHAEIVEAFRDFEAGRMGRIPPAAGADDA
ncbi:MAG: pirin family protein [Firmicutes bacterium]|nr:pirin family protein [Bacillota bacterium]